jgi:hypothetical protein
MAITGESGAFTGVFHSMQLIYVALCDAQIFIVNKRM